MAGACNTPNGGSDDIHLINHCRALAGCHGHLQSESGPSWLLHGPAGQLRRAVLSTRRKASSSVPQEELEPAREPSLAGPCTAFNAAAPRGVRWPVGLGQAVASGACPRKAVGARGLSAYSS